MRMLNQEELSLVSGGDMFFDDGDGGGGGGGDAGPTAGDIAGGVVGIAVGFATADMGAAGILTGAAAAYAASKLPVDPNQAFPVYSIPNKI
jgi:hypothetical protein